MDNKIEDIKNEQTNTCDFWKKVVDTQKLWKARGKYYEDVSVKYPRTMYLKNISELNHIDHADSLIVFLEGTLTNKEEMMREDHTAYMHNTSVLTQYDNMRYPRQPLILFHYIVIPKYNETKKYPIKYECGTIDIYMNDILLQRETLAELKMRNKVLEIIKPNNIDIPPDHKVYFINTCGLNDYNQEIKVDGRVQNIKIKCTYNDEEIQIHFTKKPSDVPHVDGYDM